MLQSCLRIQKSFGQLSEQLFEEHIADTDEPIATMKEQDWEKVTIMVAFLEVFFQCMLNFCSFLATTEYKKIFDINMLAEWSEILLNHLSDFCLLIFQQ